MNKQYIKRILTLNDIGIPMPDDIQMYYRDVCEYIGDINRLKKIEMDDDCIFWQRNSDVILQYYKTSEYVITNESIWNLLSQYGLSPSDISCIISQIISYLLNLKLSSGHKSGYGLEYSFNMMKSFS